MHNNILATLERDAGIVGTTVGVMKGAKHGLKGGAIGGLAGLAGGYAGGKLTKKLFNRDNNYSQNYDVYSSEESNEAEVPQDYIKQNFNERTNINCIDVINRILELFPLINNYKNERGYPQAMLKAEYVSLYDTLIQKHANDQEAFEILTDLDEGMDDNNYEDFINAVSRFKSYKIGKVQNVIAAMEIY